MANSTPGVPAAHRRRNRARLARLAILGASDLVALLAAGALAYLSWARPLRGQPPDLYLDVAPLALMFLLGYGQAGLYPGFGLGPVETLRRTSFVTVFGFLVLAVFSFALKLPPLYSRVTFVLAFAFGLALVPLGRSLTARLARSWNWWAEPVVVIGTSTSAAAAVRSLLAARHLGYEPAAVLSLDPQPEGARVEGVPVVGGLDGAPALAAAGVRVALLAADQPTDLDLVDQLQRHFRHVVLLREYGDLPVEGLQVRNLGDMIGVEYTNNLLLEGNRLVKRAMDLVAGGIALLLSMPVIACAALLVRVFDGAPAFFAQNRTGLGGRRIVVSKIRTMRRDAEERLGEVLAENPDLQAQWDTRYKLEADPRLIPIVGRLLRRFSIDELPQLWAVVRGDMSLVGPRPVPDYHLTKFSSDVVELRHRVRPGLTGLWQISTRSEGGLREQVSSDGYYVRNWSLWLDIYLLGRTFAAVVRGRGAF